MASTSREYMVTSTNNMFPLTPRHAYCPDVRFTVVNSKHVVFTLFRSWLRNAGSTFGSFSDVDLTRTDRCPPVAAFCFFREACKRWYILAQSTDSGSDVRARVEGVTIFNTAVTAVAYQFHVIMSTNAGNEAIPSFSTAVTALLQQNVSKHATKTFVSTVTKRTKLQEAHELIHAPHMYKKMIECCLTSSCSAIAPPNYGLVFEPGMKLGQVPPPKIPRDEPQLTPGELKAYQRKAEYDQIKELDPFNHGYTRHSVFNPNVTFSLDVQLSLLRKLGHLFYEAQADRSTYTHTIDGGRTYISAFADHPEQPSKSWPVLVMDMDTFTGPDLFCRILPDIQLYRDEHLLSRFITDTVCDKFGYTGGVMPAELKITLDRYKLLYLKYNPDPKALAKTILGETTTIFDPDNGGIPYDISTLDARERMFDHLYGLVWGTDEPILEPLPIECYGFQYEELFKEDPYVVFKQFKERYAKDFCNKRYEQGDSVRERLGLDNDLEEAENKANQISLKILEAEAATPRNETLIRQLTEQHEKTMREVDKFQRAISNWKLPTAAEEWAKTVKVQNKVLFALFKSMVWDVDQFVPDATKTAIKFLDDPVNQRPVKEPLVPLAQDMCDVEQMLLHLMMRLEAVQLESNTHRSTLCFVLSALTSGLPFKKDEMCRVNMIMHGDAAVGKSHVLNLGEKLLLPNILMTLQWISKHTLDTVRDALVDKVILTHEADMSRTSSASSNQDSTFTNLKKCALTEYVIQAMRVTTDPDTRKLIVEKVMSWITSSWIEVTNEVSKGQSADDRALRDRFMQFPMPRVRRAGAQDVTNLAIFSGSTHPTTREAQDEFSRMMRGMHAKHILLETLGADKCGILPCVDQTAHQLLLSRIAYILEKQFHRSFGIRFMKVVLLIARVLRNLTAVFNVFLAADGKYSQTQFVIEQMEECANHMCGKTADVVLALGLFYDNIYPIEMGELIAPIEEALVSTSTDRVFRFGSADNSTAFPQYYPDRPLCPQINYDANYVIFEDNRRTSKLNAKSSTEDPFAMLIQRVYNTMGSRGKKGRQVPMSTLTEFMRGAFEETLSFVPYRFKAGVPIHGSDVEASSIADAVEPAPTNVRVEMPLFKLDAQNRVLICTHLFLQPMADRDQLKEAIQIALGSDVIMPGERLWTRYLATEEVVEYSVFDTLQVRRTPGKPWRVYNEHYVNPLIRRKIMTGKFRDRPFEVIKGNPDDHVSYIYRHMVGNTATLGMPDDPYTVLGAARAMDDLIKKYEDVKGPAIKYPSDLLREERKRRLYHSKAWGTIDLLLTEWNAEKEGESGDRRAKRVHRIPESPPASPSWDDPRAVGLGNLLTSPTTAASYYDEEEGMENRDDAMDL